MLNPIIHNTKEIDLLLKERPILVEMKNRNPLLIHLDTNDLTHSDQIYKLLDGISTNNFILLDFNQRYKKRPLDFLRFSIIKILKPVTALTGTKIISNLNENFDYFFELIPILKKHNLVDYYITSDCTSAYLLFK